MKGIAAMPIYDLPESECRARGLAALYAYPSDGPFVALAVKPDDLLADVARTVERRVFEESFAMDAAVMTDEYAAYEQDSIFLLVIDRRTGAPAGAARLIDGGGKTLDDAPAAIGVDLGTIAEKHGLFGGRIWDFATLAVLPEYRGGKSTMVSSLLYRAFINAGRRAGVQHVVAMLDSRAYKGIMRIGVPFEPMAGSKPFDYLGSPSTSALYARFADIAPAIAAQGERLSNAEPAEGESRARSLRRLITQRVVSKVAHQVATGEGLDEHVDLPALERRRMRRLR
jgi:N-acyl-L-homoserine lactone synthetase